MLSSSMNRGATDSRSESETIRDGSPKGQDTTATPSGLDSRQPDPPAIPGGDGIVCVIVNGRVKVCGS